jgi:pimeloyl-ACP methyl ester carboxylesterase
MGALTGPVHAAKPKQPPQPESGPGGSDYAHESFSVASGGTGVNAWYVFQPTDPQPSSAPVAVVMHGYGEYSGYDMMGSFIEHTVRTGKIVVYPRWQVAETDPCLGPINIEPCMASAQSGIEGALSYLTADESRVQPDLDRVSYFGYSFGGIITANLANRYEDLELPEPRAIFLDDPHDGGLVGFDEPAVDDSLAGIPSTVKLQCHSGADGVIGEPNKADASCNSLFPKLTHIPAENKDLVMTRTDKHGKPALSSEHGVCDGNRVAGDAFGKPNAYDWNFCWKTWDALQSCAYSETDCEYALGDTPKHRSHGRWSDRRKVKPLTIQDAAPLVP